MRITSEHVVLRSCTLPLGWRPGKPSQVPVPGGAQPPQDAGLPRKWLGATAAATRDSLVESWTCRAGVLPTRTVSSCLQGPPRLPGESRAPTHSNTGWALWGGHGSTASSFWGWAGPRPRGPLCLATVPGLQGTTSCICILSPLDNHKKDDLRLYERICLFLTLCLFEHCRRILCQENLFSRTTFGPEPASPAWPAQYRPHCLHVVPFFSDGQVSFSLVIL